MAIILIVMILLTIKYQRGNTFRNYCNSVFQTYNLRSFSKIQVKTTRVKVDNGWKNQKNNNPAEIAFNRALQGWYIDKRKNNLTVWLLLPESSDGQIIFDQKLPGIENNIRHRYMDYTFSPAEQLENYYRIEATRY